jgi:hypothetical protein
MVAASRVRLVRVVFLSQALLAAGCGGAAAPGSVGEFYERAFAALCRWAVGCGSYPDVATCHATLAFDSDVATVQAYVDSGRVRYDAAKAAGCIAYYERVFGSACRLSAIVNTGTEAQVCQEVFTGTVPDAGACFIDEECVSGGCQLADPACLRSQQCCPGTCEARVEPTPVGGDCSVTGICVPGSSCTTPIGGTTRICTVPSTVRGTPCTATAHCASPLYCNLDLTTLMGTCEPLSATGQPCNPDGLLPCDDGRDYCDQATATCTRRGGVGSACDPAQPHCLALARCVGTTCVANAAEGGACAATNGPDCLGNLECSAQTNTCVLPAPDPGPCF